MSKDKSVKQIQRRDFLQLTLAGIGTLALPVWRSQSFAANIQTSPVFIGTRRELFVDNVLIESLIGQAEQRLGSPQPAEVVIVHDAPWEGSGSGYHSIFFHDGLYRMYYKAWQLEVTDKGVNSKGHPLYCCYAESRNGIDWVKPNLGLFEFNGSKDNNIIMATGNYFGLEIDAGHPAVFFDENPSVQARSQFKAIFRSAKPHGLLAFHSPDGIRWQPMQMEPIITEGAFDSQNVAFWDSERGEYRAYWRIFTEGTTTGEQWKPEGYRAIRTASSPDFLHWGPTEDITYTDSPSEHLYTNQIKPYHRAPHLLIGFPTRYIDRGWSESMNELPEFSNRRKRSTQSERYGTAITEGLIMTSRDRVKFKRWNEAFLRPGIERPGTWNYGHQYIAWHLVETPSTLDGAPSELSLYATESYWTGNSSALRRYTLRLDGFVSVHAGARGGELITRPLIFNGNLLSLNMSTSAAGIIRVEIQDESGQPLPGYSLNDSVEIFGDNIDRKACWKNGKQVGKLAGKPVRLRFELMDADLYAIQFMESE